MRKLPPQNIGFLVLLRGLGGILHAWSRVEEGSSLGKRNNRNSSISSLSGHFTLRQCRGTSAQPVREVNLVTVYPDCSASPCARLAFTTRCNVFLNLSSHCCSTSCLRRVQDHDAKSSHLETLTWEMRVVPSRGSTAISICGAAPLPILSPLQRAHEL